MTSACRGEYWCQNIFEKTQLANIFSPLDIVIKKFWNIKNLSLQTFSLLWIFYINDIEILKTSACKYFLSSGYWYQNIMKYWKSELSNIFSPLDIWYQKLKYWKPELVDIDIKYRYKYKYKYWREQILNCKNLSLQAASMVLQRGPAVGSQWNTWQMKVSWNKYKFKHKYKYKYKWRCPETIPYRNTIKITKTNTN